MQIDHVKSAKLIERLRYHPILIIMDTEQTCWEGVRERAWSGPNEMREIIQIGAVAVDTKDFSEITSLEIIVKPIKNPVLSPFCINLTGITQERIEREGVPFPEAYRDWVDFVDGCPVLVYQADEDVMRENLQLHGMRDTVPPYLKCRDLLVSCGIDMNGINSGKIARHLGSEKSYREHDALTDVRSMADGLAILANDYAAA